MDELDRSLDREQTYSLAAAMKASSFNDPNLVFNGVDGATGGYLYPPMSVRELGVLARQGGVSGREVRRFRSQSVQTRSMGPREGVDPCRLEEAGWGVIFARDADPNIRQALEPLLEHRRRQASRRRTGRYCELAGDAGYRPDESKLRFLARHGVGSGPADPDRLPYYLMLVGDPETIPYEFQHQLDVKYAVGRICFESLEDYANYARSVVASEQGAFQRPRQATFFGVRKDGDRATELTHDHLVKPLAHQLARDAPGWEVIAAAGAEATKERLGHLMGGAETPALLFTGSHGLGFRFGDARQRDQQGALVCQDWSPRRTPNRRRDSPYFTAADIDDTACSGGLIAFMFACFSAGTPRRNDYAYRSVGEARELCERSFVARLPQRLLSHPRGGALAVVGHVDRAWTYSFLWPLAGRQIEVFASTMRRLLAGHPLGSAMEYFNHSYAELECGLADLRQRFELDQDPDLLELGKLWTARNDARNFVIVGDPAVRLPVSARKALE